MPRQIIRALTDENHKTLFYVYGISGIATQIDNPSPVSGLVGSSGYAQMRMETYPILMLSWFNILTTIV